MNKVLIGVLLAVIVGVVLWKLDVFGGKAPEEPATSNARPGDPATTAEPPTTLNGGARPPAREEPKDEPKPERFPLESKLRVLFVVDRVMQWPQFMGVVLKSDQQIAFTYYSVRPQADEPPLVTEGEQPVVERPTAEWFESQNFDVLVVGACDPGDLGDDFWQVVAKRVRAGQLGLWVWPSLPPTPPGKSQGAPVHPMLTHPLFHALLPVEEAARLEGKPTPGSGAAPAVPGIFAKEARFSVTDAGTTHPATRIVPFAKWSRSMWGAGAAGPQPWGSKFVYPVTKLRAGAVTLVSAVPEKGSAIPMFVQGAAEGGRVLWFGAHDFGDATYRTLGAPLEKWNSVIHNSIVWLAGRAPRE